MELRMAEGLAIEICQYLQKDCEENKIHIAGSIRRRRHEVKDIEIVLLPKRVDHFDIFGAVIDRPVTSAFKNRIENTGRIIKGNANGRMMQVELQQKIMVDFFMPEKNDFYRIYAIRTGSSLYAHNVIAGAWLALGWCGSDCGLRRQDDCRRYKDSAGKVKWQCINKNGELPPVWQSEQELFDWLRIKYIHPVRRDM